MLWYKAWLETRWRFGFVAASVLLVLLTPLWLPLAGMPPGVPASRLWMGVHQGSVLLYLFAAIFLAGAGINTQTNYGAMTGFHGSMLFTLSLPVSRRRLLFVRAGLGAIETCAMVLLMVVCTLMMRPGSLSAMQAVAYGTRAVMCTMAVYALAVLLACVLDEMWQFTGACLFWAVFFFLQSRVGLVAQVSPLRGMSLVSYRITEPMPWGPVAGSVVLTLALLYAAMVVVQRKEY